MALALTNPGVAIGGNVQTSSTSTLGAGAGGSGFGGAGALKAAQFALAAYSLVDTLDALSDMKSGITQQSNFNRKIARENAATDTFKIETAAFRRHKTMTAQASVGGFALASKSTTALFDRDKADVQVVKTQIQKNLNNTLQEIQRMESEAKRGIRGAKTKAFTSFAGSILGG